MDAFRRHGADLDPAGKTRLEAIDVESDRLTTKFSENVLDATNAFELIIDREAELAGFRPARDRRRPRERCAERMAGLALHPAGAELYARDDLP